MSLKNKNKNYLTKFNQVLALKVVPIPKCTTWSGVTEGGGRVRVQGEEESPLGN